MLYVFGAGPALEKDRAGLAACIGHSYWSKSAGTLVVWALTAAVLEKTKNAEESIRKAKKTVVAVIKIFLFISFHFLLFWGSISNRQLITTSEWKPHHQTVKYQKLKRAPTQNLTIDYNGRRSVLEDALPLIEGAALLEFVTGSMGCLIEQKLSPQSDKALPESRLNAAKKEKIRYKLASGSCNSRATPIQNQETGGWRWFSAGSRTSQTSHRIL